MALESSSLDSVFTRSETSSIAVDSLKAASVASLSLELRRLGDVAFRGEAGLFRVLLPLCRVCNANPFCGRVCLIVGCRVPLLGKGSGAA